MLHFGAHLSLLQLRFDGCRRQDPFVAVFHLLELLRSNEADAPSRGFCNQYPGDLFHVASAYDARVIVGRTFRDEKSNTPLRVARATEDVHLPYAVTLHDARGTASRA